jgi:signal transduction histidine kinase
METKVRAISLQLEAFFIAPLIASVARSIEPLATKNANKVAIHCHTAIGILHGDQMRLRQALLNVMFNANKVTDRGTITVDARQARESGRDWVTIAVTDTGPGMTAKQMGDLLFQEGGTGFGLWISKRFCQMMGGDLTFESEPGRGSTFTIRVPRIVDAAKRRAAVN